jgi:hypothetical protein
MSQGDLKMDVGELPEEVQRWISETGRREDLEEVGAVEGHPDTYYIRFDLDGWFQILDQVDRFPKAWRLFSVYTDGGSGGKPGYGITFLFQRRTGRRRGVALPERLS